MVDGLMYLMRTWQRRSLRQLAVEGLDDIVYYREREGHH